MRAACLRFLEGARSELAERVSLSARLAGEPPELAPRLAAAAERFPRAGRRAGAAQPRGALPAVLLASCAARVRATRAGERGGYARPRRSCWPTCAPPSALRRDQRRVRRGRRPARRDPPGRGVRLPLRAGSTCASTPTATGAALAEILADARRARRLRGAGGGRAHRAARARDRRAAAADPVRPRAASRPTTREVVEHVPLRCASCSTAGTPARSQTYVVSGTDGAGRPARGAAADEGERARARPAARARCCGSCRCSRPASRCARRAATMRTLLEQPGLPRGAARGRRRAGGDDRLLGLQQGRRLRRVRLGDLPRAGGARRGAARARRRVDRSSTAAAARSAAAAGRRTWRSSRSRRARSRAA